MLADKDKKVQVYNNRKPKRETIHSTWLLGDKENERDIQKNKKLEGRNIKNASGKLTRKKLRKIDWNNYEEPPSNPQLESGFQSTGTGTSSIFLMTYRG